MMRDISQFGIYGCYLHVNLWKKPLIVLEKRNKFIKNKANKTLAGNINEEYDIPELMPEYESFICTQIINFSFFKRTADMLRNTLADHDFGIRLNRLWVNYMKKHEFNPMHTHGGLFSFVVFVKIPYDLKTELAKSPGKKSNSNFTSTLQFQYFDAGGIPMEVNVPVDKSYEGGIYIFNASTRHLVYPFFTSDDYRITLAGNIIPCNFVPLEKK